MRPRSDSVAVTLACIIAVWPAPFLAQDGAGSADARSAAARSSAVQVRGRWVLAPGGKVIAIESFRRGLQTSALAWRKGELWSFGDQRSEYPARLLRIDPATGLLLGPPIDVAVPAAAAGDSAALSGYRALRNPDFEGIALHPHDPCRILAVTEDKSPCLLAIEATGSGAAGDGAGAAADPAGAPTLRLTKLTPIRFPEGVVPWRDDLNYRIEGLAWSNDAKTLYFAFERAADELPRILSLDAADLDRLEVEPAVLPIDFAAVPRRADKAPARLNLNDLIALRLEGKDWLIGVARDQERILAIDVAERRVAQWVDLDLRDADDQPIHWASPEGIAADPASGRLWVITDPDSQQGNYRRRDTETAAPPYYLNCVPLLFELELSRVLPEGAAGKGAGGR